ncbi:MAG TPA: DNA-3-methyladenine glycosylase I [Stellaceae bacterium]|nr:DNA-3-methyladenine glycosylase I [Stellaceae bacterium]
MVAFGPILARAEARNGGAAALAAKLPAAKSAAELRAIADDRYFSLMALRIFRAGLKHSLVDAKWPAFEEAFHGFVPQRVRAMNDEEIEALLKDARLIRHLGKLRATHQNAAAFCAIAAEQGSFGAYLAEWPGERIVALWDDLATRFQQMGGNSGPMFLRMAGKDTFILSPSVVAALQHWGAVAAPPKSKADRARVQDLFNGWAGETGRPLCELSMILAQSVD